MRHINMVEIQSLDLDWSFKCKYCNKDLSVPTDRVEVIDLKSNQILYVYCQTDECMSIHIREFYKVMK